MYYLENSYKRELLMEPEESYGKKEPEYVNLMDDMGFKHVFAREANKDILIAFLNEIIPDKEIVDLEHIRNEQVPSAPEQKKSVFDLYCKTQDGSRIVVELQRKPQFDYVDRAIYYGTFPVQSQVEAGNKKYSFSAVYIINILNFNLAELKGVNGALSIFRLKELSTNKILSEKYTVIFIELRKFAKKLEEISPDNILEGFLYSLRHIHCLKEQPKEFQQQILNRLFEAAKVAKMNKQERQAYIKKMDTERDIINQWEYAMEQAQTEGMAKGRAEEKISIAKLMKAKGYDIEAISDCTSLPIEEIEQL